MIYHDVEVKVDAQNLPEGEYDGRDNGVGEGHVGDEEGGDGGGPDPGDD